MYQIYLIAGEKNDLDYIEVRADNFAFDNCLNGNIVSFYSDGNKVAVFRMSEIIGFAEV